MGFLRKLTALLLTALLCTCAAQAEVAVLVDRLDDYRAAVYAGMEKISPYKLTCIDAKGSAQRQRRQFEQALEGTPDAIVLNPVSMRSDYIADLLARAQQTGVPVVLFNREPEELDVVTQYGEFVAYVGTDARQAGRLQGEEIVHLLAEHPEYDKNGDGVLQYMMLVGEEGNPESDGRTEGCLSTLAQLGIAAEAVVPNALCGWESMAAMDAVQSALYEGILPEIIISNSDEMAIGAVAALNEVGINLVGGDVYIPVVGVDATPAAIDLIDTGKMTATVTQDSAAMARAVIDVVRGMGSGSTALEAIAAKGYAAEAGLPVLRIDYHPYSQGGAE